MRHLRANDSVSADRMSGNSRDNMLINETNGSLQVVGLSLLVMLQAADQFLNVTIQLLARNIRPGGSA